MHSLTGAELLVATGNAGKLDEFASFLRPFRTRLRSLSDLHLPEPEETECTFTGNALLKARSAARLSGLVTLADDSGLVVDDLGGAPGIYTADWAETGKGRDFTRAMQRTNALLQAVGSEGRVAHFVCVLAVVWPTGEEAVFEGRVSGRLVWPMRGVLGHGYDPIFQPDGDAMTLAEMDISHKNQISHRSRAFSAFAQGCFT